MGFEFFGVEILFAGSVLQHLAGHHHEGEFPPSESWSGPDPDPDPDPSKERADSVQSKKHPQARFCGKGEKAKGKM